MTFEAGSRWSDRSRGAGGLTCQYKPSRDRTTVFHLLRRFFFPSAIVAIVSRRRVTYFSFIYSVFRRLFAHSPPPNPPATNGRRVHRSPSRAADLSAKTRRPRTRVVFTAVRRTRISFFRSPIIVVKAEEQRRKRKCKN